MSRPIRVFLISTASAALAACASACGTEKLQVARSDSAYQGAVLFSQRCSGCHTLSYAATHGSAVNVRTREVTNGPNFNVRCERPITRVLYAIENGGFSGAIMPQNVVVGQDAIKVAQFVATYSGRQASTQPGGTTCLKEPIGAVPARGTNPAASSTPSSAPKAPTSPPGTRGSKRGGKTAFGSRKRKHKRP